jgi:hypothetical protein
VQNIKDDARQCDEMIEELIEMHPDGLFCEGARSELEVEVTFHTLTLTLIAPKSARSSRSIQPVTS